jgi:hypothetical protein
MNELVTFLLARIADEVAAASAAKTGNRWWVDGPALHSERWWVYDTDGLFKRREVAEHIARWDPDRVLVELEAKREMVEEFALTCRLRDEAAERVAAAAGRPAAEDLDSWSRAHREAGVWGPWVRQFGLSYASHDDYREEWRP